MRVQVRFNMGPFKAHMAAVAGEGDVFNEEGYLWSVASHVIHTPCMHTSDTHFGQPLPLSNP